MSHRSVPRRLPDDDAFPVRIKLPVLGLGLVLLEVLRWLRHEVGEANFANHDAECLEGEALALHVRRVEGVSALLSAFPHLALAGATTSRRYSSGQGALRRKRS